jgi:two-component system response regulator NreC
MSIRILLADDHIVVREGLTNLLAREGFDVVAEASNGHEVIRLAREQNIDVAILDIFMPLLNGLDTARELLKTTPKTKVILLTMHKEEQYVLEALRAGVSGYVLKSQAGQDLVQAIHEVAKGSVYLSPAVTGTVVKAYLAEGEAPVSSVSLTSRERAVLQLIAEGKTTKEIAQLLGVGVKTAESHRTNLMKKLDIHETAGLVRYAIRHGLIQP